MDKIESICGQNWTNVKIVRGHYQASRQGPRERNAISACLDPRVLIQVQGDS